MSKEVKASSTDVVASDLDFGGDQEILSEEVVIPKVLVMQPASKFVLDPNHPATFGDFVDSMSGEKLGSVGEPLEFIPFHLERVWYVSKKVNGDFKFAGVEEVTTANSGRAYETTIDGVDYKYEKALNFYVQLPSDMTLPRILSFKGMSRRAGEVLYTEMYVKNKMAKKRHVDTVFELVGTNTSNDKGTFVVLSTRRKRDTSEDELRNIHPWFTTLRAENSTVQADESDQGAGVDVSGVDTEF